MRTNDQQFAGFDANTFRNRRLVYFADEKKEAAPVAAQIPEAETLEKRKQQARKEIDGIYELGEYDTYNFRKLPQEFKDHLKENFGQWVDGNIKKYDDDKDSGINAKEYETFKTELTKKVKGVLDRLAELKKEKKKEAENAKESAEAAKEAQKRLKGVDVSKMDDKNLDSADGTYTELLKYQKDFENEATDFGKLTAVFTDAKDKAENANKSHYTGATGIGEYIVSITPWTEDIPEVKDAKAAKESAITDFQTKLAEMKKRQKDRQERGKKLNGTPENLRAPTQEKYEKYRADVTTQLDVAHAKKKENDDNKAKAQRQLKDIETARTTLQRQYDEIASRYYLVSYKQKKAAEESAEVAKAEEGLGSAEEQIAERRGEAGGAPQPQLDEAAGKVAKAKEEVTSAGKAMKAAGTGADLEVTNMGETMYGIQGQLTKLIGSKDKAEKLEKSLTAADPVITESITKYGKMLEDVNKAEKDEMDSIDSLDEAISGTVLEVDTSNFELIRQDDTYLKTLKQLDIKGPGALDMVGAAVKGIPGVEKALDWTGSKLTQAWNWAKRAPVLGAMIGVVGYMGEGWTKSWDWIGKELGDFADWAHLPEAWDWMSEASKHLSIGNPTGNAALDAILDTFTGGGLGTIIEVFAGVTEGCKDLVKGLGMIVRNPFDMIKGIGHLVNHPGMIIDAFIQKDKWGEESSSKIIGRMMVDVVATLSGAGATTQGVKTAIAAVKIGEVGAARAMLLGVRTFGEVFVKDISQMALGILKVPGNAVKGIGELVTTLANGGKKLEPVESATVAGAKRAAVVEEGYRAVEATRGKPSEFIKLMREHPEFLDLHARYEKMLVKAEQKVAKTTPKEAEKEKTPAKVSGSDALVGADEVTKPGGNIQNKASAESKLESGAATTAKAASEAEIASLKPHPDFTPKPKTAERTQMVGTLEDLVKDNPALKAAAKTLSPSEFYRLAEALPTEELRLLANSAEKLDATLIQRILKQEYEFTINSKGEKVRFYSGETLGSGGFGVVSDCAYVVGGGERLETAAMKRPKNMESLRVEIQDIADMLHANKLSPAEFDRLHQRMSKTREKLREKDLKPADREKLSERLATLDEQSKTQKLTDTMREELRARMADYNFQLNSTDRIFTNERIAMQAVMEFGDVPGLLKPRIVSKNGLDHVIIYDKINPLPGREISLKDRILSGEAPGMVLQYFYESLLGLDAVHTNGWFHMDYKPENVFVGQAAKGAEQGILGDLALVSVEEIAHLRLIPTGGKAGEKSRSYAVVRMGPNGSIADSRQIGFTPSYFNPDHMNALIEYAKDAVKEARSLGLDPNKVKIPKDVLALADKNQVGVSFERYISFLEGIEDGKVVPGKKVAFAKKCNIPVSGIDELITELRYYSAQLKNPGSGVSIPEVMVALEAARSKLARAGASASELPKTLSI